MSASTFNPLATARDLKAAGIEAEHAEAIAEGMREAVSADRDELATKTDIAELRSATQADIAELRSATQADFAELRAATRADLADIRTDLAGLEGRMYRALWIQAAALIGTQLAIAGFIVHLLSTP